MPALMGVVKNEHGVYSARKKVPAALQRAVAQVLGQPGKRSWLKKSLGTKDLKQANVLAKPVLAEFDKLLARAAESVKASPVREVVTDQELKRMAEHYYACLLLEDDTLRALPPPSGLRGDDPPRAEGVFQELDSAEQALARGGEWDTDTGEIAFEREVDDTAATFGMSLPEGSAARKQVASALLHARVRAFHIMRERNKGVPHDTPKQRLAIAAPVTGGTNLTDALEGWKRERTRPKNTVTEYSRAVSMFIQMHGNLPVSEIRKKHASEFRAAVQYIPKRRAAALQRMALPELAEWGKAHADVQKIAAGSVNKRIGALQAVVGWANLKGAFIDENTSWANPFNSLRLPEDESTREPFGVNNLNTLFATPVFAEGARPEGGGGEAAYWLPILSLFTGARLTEIGSLQAFNVKADVSGIFALNFERDRKVGKTLKTSTSVRTVPVHPQLIALGFLGFVDSVRSRDGDEGWLFPEIAPPKGTAAWSKWFGRYIRSLGIADPDVVFHSMRHAFKDSLRQAGVEEGVADALAGQAGMRGSVARSYGSKNMVTRFGMKRLAEVVGAIEYEGLQLPPAPRP